MKTLFLSPLQPQNAAGGGGGGGVGVGGVSRLRFPPGPHFRSSRFSRHPRLRQAPTRRFAKNRNLRGLGGFCGEPGGPGPKPWGPGPQAPWRPGPQAPGAWIPPLSPVDFLQAKFLTSCSLFAPAFQPLRPQAPGDLANKPLSPASRQPSRVKNSKNALMKSLACCTD